MSRSKAGRDRRDALVGAAQRAMLEHGADAKLRHVAEAAGLTSGAVLYHFPDVQALLLEANRAGMERFYDQRIAALAKIDDPVEKLIVTVRTGLPVDSQDASVRLLCELGDASGAHRATLTAYSRGYLSYVRAVASGVTIMAYCLWAFESAAKTGSQTWFEISIVPFVLAILRYAHVIEQGRGGAPEDIILSDRVIQVLGLLWAVTFAIGVYA